MRLMLLLEFAFTSVSSSRKARALRLSRVSCLIDDNQELQRARLPFSASMAQHMHSSDIPGYTLPGTTLACCLLSSNFSFHYRSIRLVSFTSLSASLSVFCVAKVKASRTLKLFFFLSAKPPRMHRWSISKVPERLA